jgi:hypothetical protein
MQVASGRRPGRQPARRRAGRVRRSAHVQPADGTRHIDADPPNPPLAALDLVPQPPRCRRSVFVRTIRPAARRAPAPPPSPPIQNIFMLGGIRRHHAQEWVARLCPADLPHRRPSACSTARRRGRPVPRATERHRATERVRHGGIARDDRCAEARRFIDRFGQGRVPILTSTTSLPHGPWHYRRRNDLPLADSSRRPLWPRQVSGVSYHVDCGAVLRRRRPTACWARLLDRLDEAGTLDDRWWWSRPTGRRSCRAGGRQVSGSYPGIMWSPLLVKRPGQRPPGR